MIIPAVTTLENHVVRLEALSPEHSTEMFHAFDDPAVWAAGWGGGPAARPDTEAGMGPVVDRLISGGYAWAVREAGTGDLVGTASLLDVDPVNERCMVGGAAYSPRVWGTSVNAATNLALLGYAFEGCGAGRVMFATDVLNTRMCRALEKMGATAEGVLRRHKRRGDGSFRDSAVFSMLADEWPEIRTRLEERVGRDPHTA